MRPPRGEAALDETFYVDAFLFESAYKMWAVEKGVVGSGMAADNDGDGLSNLGEWALNGNPTDADDQGMTEIFISGADFVYVHAMLNDTNDVSYTVEYIDSGDLMFGNWVMTDLTITSGAFDAGYHMVTNSIPMSGNQGFIRLQIDEL